MMADKIEETSDEDCPTPIYEGSSNSEGNLDKFYALILHDFLNSRY